jgi:leucyl aminopeptidase
VANHPDEEGRKLVKEVRVLQFEDLKKEGMGLFVGVGQGAVHLPRCVIVLYQGNPNSDEIDLALVGKGIVFDAGGLNLKVLGGIENMYGDKNGACAVIGTLHGCLSLKPKKNVIFAAGLAENSIGSRAYRPSDILQSMKGLTVAIGNTDAEGRLVLADTMTYVQRNFKPKRLIDLATLTGACMIALGATTAGLWSNKKAVEHSFLKEI